MASLPSQHPTLSLHLADDALTPLITSSRSRAHLESLTSLATSALTSRTAASRVGMGAVERIMIEYPSPAAAAVVLQSYLHVPEPPSLPLSDADTTASSSTTTTTTTTTTMGGGKNLGAEDGEGEDQSGTISSPPRLVSVVVAGRPQDASEARRAAARLERIGREFQSQWSASSS
ncbi:hypothetical protein PWT90_04751 [Aphanocladium album]|nr:hypothetical protein PWT90_04751 [Aphanocladium album]